MSYNTLTIDLIEGRPYWGALLKSPYIIYIYIYTHTHTPHYLLIYYFVVNKKRGRIKSVGGRARAHIRWCLISEKQRDKQQWAFRRTPVLDNRFYSREYFFHSTFFSQALVLGFRVIFMRQTDYSCPSD